MNETMRVSAIALRGAAGAAALLLAAGAALAQDAARPAASVAADPNPYYVGVSQGFTHDSNVYRIPSGPGDNYSSTSLFGGFDQPISRQRLYGRASVSLNRFQDQTVLNNTSYDLSTGVDWATIENLSGNVNASLNRSLSAPAASASSPAAVRNLVQTERIDARARWGGPALLSLEGAVGYFKVDYSAPEYVSAETRGSSASLGLYYKPGAHLRLGVAGRFTRTETPQAFFDPLTGTYQGNTVNGRNLDLLADYEVSGSLSTNARLSFTHQTDSSGSGADFSGVTGAIAVNWRPTAKITVQLDAARDAGFDSASYRANPLVLIGVTPTTTTGTFYENNRVSDTAGIAISYAVTSRIAANLGARYTRAKLVTTSAVPAGTAAPETIDELQSVYLGASYEITRNWSAGCNASYSTRDVSGGQTFSYHASTVGCSTQLIWR